MLNPARALTFASQLLRNLNASNIMKAAQIAMLEAALEVATEVNKILPHHADRLWFVDTELQLRNIAKTASTLGSRGRQQQAFQSEPVLMAPLHLTLSSRDPERDCCWLLAKNAYQRSCDATWCWITSVTALGLLLKRPSTECLLIAAFAPFLLIAQSADNSGCTSCP